MSQPPTSSSPGQPDQPDQPDRSERPEPPPYFLPPPPPPAAPGPEEHRPAEHSKTISILALVFGGAAVLFSLIPVAGIFLGGLFGIAAIVLGIVGIFISHRLFAIIGIALAIIGLIIAIIITIAVGKSAEKIIEDWPTNYEDLTDEPDEEQPKDEIVDGTDPNAPLPAGTEIETGNWRVVISNVVPDAADAIATEAEYYAPPAEGYQYYMFQVDATYEGQGSAVAWDELAFGVYFNETLNAEYCEATLPNDLWEAPEVYTDGTATGNHCVAVPSEGVEDAVISVEEYWSSGERYFVSAS